MRDLPEEINEAITTLWNYSDDACISGRTKAECGKEGYECKGETAYYITFVIPRCDS